MLLSIRTITPKDDNARRKVEKKNISEPEEKKSGLFQWPQIELKQVVSQWGIK